MVMKWKDKKESSLSQHFITHRWWHNRNVVLT
jgi:hypothetical protein